MGAAIQSPNIKENENNKIKSRSSIENTKTKGNPPPSPRWTGSTSRGRKQHDGGEAREVASVSNTNTRTHGPNKPGANPRGNTHKILRK